MGSIRDLLESKNKVKLSGGDVEIYGVRIKDIIKLVSNNPELISAFKKEDGTERASAIVSVIMKSGEDVINEVIELITKSEKGDAKKSHLTAIDELEIITSGVKLSIPEDRMGKIVADIQNYLGISGQ